MQLQKTNNEMKRTQQQNKELELILNFLGINFIDYQNKN